MLAGLLYNLLNSTLYLDELLIVRRTTLQLQIFSRFRARPGHTHSNPTVVSCVRLRHSAGALPPILSPSQPYSPS